MTKYTLYVPGIARPFELEAPVGGTPEAFVTTVTTPGTQTLPIAGGGTVTYTATLHAPVVLVQS